MEAYQEQTPLETGDAFFYAHRHPGTAPGEMVGAHWHDACELLFIRRGRGEQLLNARVLPFAQDDLIVIRPSDIHATWALSPDGCEIDEVMFDQRVLRLPDSSFFACTLTSQCPFACCVKKRSCVAQSRRCAAAKASRRPQKRPVTALRKALSALSSASMASRRTSQRRPLGRER